jgi:hypothetical protein
MEPPRHTRCMHAYITYTFTRAWVVNTDAALHTYVYVHTRIHKYIHTCRYGFLSTEAILRGFGTNDACIYMCIYTCAHTWVGHLLWKACLYACICMYVTNSTQNPIFSEDQCYVCMYVSTQRCLKMRFLKSMLEGHCMYIYVIIFRVRTVCVLFTYSHVYFLYACYDYCKYGYNIFCSICFLHM